MHMLTVIEIEEVETRIDDEFLFLEPCNNDNLMDLSHTVHSIAASETMYCLTPEAKSKARIAGCSSCPQHTKIVIDFKPCGHSDHSDYQHPDGVVCADKETVGHYFASRTLVYKVLTNFIDFKDVENPIHNIVSTHHLDLEYDQQGQVELFERRFTLDRLDTRLQLFSGGTTDQFLDWDKNIDKTYRERIHSHWSYFRVFMHGSPRKDHSTRRFYSFFDCLADIGGLYGSLFIFGALFNLVYNDRAIQFTFGNALYRTAKYSKSAGTFKSVGERRKWWNSLSKFKLNCCQKACQAFLCCLARGRTRKLLQKTQMRFERHMDVAL